MTIFKNTKKRIWQIAGITALLCLVLLIHIILVSKPQQVDNATIQIARINFTPDPEAREIANVVANVRGIEGVKVVNYFSEQSVLVAAFDNMITDNNALMACVQSIASSPAMIDVPDTAIMAKGCPFGSGDSFTRKISLVVKKLFY